MLYETETNQPPGGDKIYIRDKMTIVDQNIKKIQTLCDTHRVSRLYVFGSALTPRFSQHSDVDFVVDFKQMPLEDYADNYMNLHDALAQLLGRDIDLLEERGIRNRSLYANISRTRKQIYG